MNFLTVRRFGFATVDMATRSNRCSLENRTGTHIMKRSNANGPTTNVNGDIIAWNSDYQNKEAIWRVAVVAVVSGETA